MLIVHIAQLAKEVGAALGPVQLIKIHVVGLEPLETGVDGLMKVFPAHFGPTANMIQAWACCLGGDDHVITGTARLQPGANVAFGEPLRLRLGGTGYISAVSMKLMPNATARSSCS